MVVLMRQGESCAQLAHFFANFVDHRFVALGFEYAINERPDPAHVVLFQPTRGGSRRTDTYAARLKRRALLMRNRILVDDNARRFEP